MFSLSPTCDGPKLLFCPSAVCHHLCEFLYSPSLCRKYCSVFRDHWGNPDVDGRTILRWIFRKWEGVVGTGWSWLRIGTGGEHL